MEAGVGLDRNVETAFLQTHRINGKPAVVPDQIFARRAYLDCIGLLPTSEQLNQFLSDPATDKRQQLVHKLLADKRPPEKMQENLVHSSFP